MRMGASGTIRLTAVFASLAIVAAIAPLADAGVSIGPAPTGTPTVAYVTQSGAAPPSVWTVRTDGTQVLRLGTGFSPLISPNGRQVAASLFGTSATETGPALAVYSTTGAAPQTFLSLAGGNAQPLAWSRDERYVAVGFTSNAVKNTPQKSGLVIVDLVTDSAKTITNGQIFGASFAPNGSDEIVYGRTLSESLTAPVNLYRSKVDGSQTVALTRDGRSLYPVWGPSVIAYDHERLRRNDAPVFQIWLRSATGSSVRRLTNIRVRTLVSGLVPIAFSADGGKLLAEFTGQDTSEAWTVRVATGRARRLTARSRRNLQAAGISSDGNTVLVDEGGFEGPASDGRVATMPFAGGRSTMIVSHGSQASWNG